MHVPWSLGTTKEDKILSSMDHLIGKEVVITEKMDGECTSLYRSGRHARSLDSTHHVSRDWLAAYHSSIAYCIPRKWRICGEYLYAKHTIPYDDLESYFLAFSLWDDTVCMDWDSTVEFFETIDVKTVPVIWTGILTLEVLKEIEAKLNLEKQEGYVVRLKGSFEFDDFASSVCKFVRPNHVQTDEHWMSKAVIPNKLRIKSS